MRINVLTVSALAVAMLAPAALAQTTFTPRDETPEEYPAGPGRDDAFYACTACHGFRLVAQQGLNRRQWEESIDLMTTKHGMPKLEGNDRNIVLDYLETTYPRRAPTGGGWQNPFLSR